MFGLGTTEIIIILAVLMMLALPLAIFIFVAKMQRSNLKKCPFCAEMIQPEAVVCRFCSRDLVK